MTYVVVGATGLLGRHISRLLASRRLPRVLFGHATSSRNRHVSSIDIRDAQAVETAIQRVVPRVVINAADRKTDWRTTALGPANLARACERHGVRLVHISSDVVFSGRHPSYDEGSVPDPTTPYGAAKAAAETAVAMFDNAIIVRTSWLVGDGMAPFDRAWAPRVAGDGASPLDRAVSPFEMAVSPFEELVREVAAGAARASLYVDDIAAPLHAADLASAVLEIAEQSFSGTIHVAGREPMSRHDLATAYARWAGLDGGPLPQGRRYGDAGPIEVKLDSSMARSILRSRIRPISEVYGVDHA